MTSPPEDRHRVVAMRDVLAHRGPDDAGLFVDGQAALGHRRLSIVDLAAGKQPLANEDETIWITLQRRDLQPPRPEARARRRAATSIARGRTPRASSTPTSSGATPASTTCAACSRSRSGIPVSRRLLVARDRLGRQAALLGALRRPAASSRPRSRPSSRAASSPAAAERRRHSGAARHAVARRQRHDVPGHLQAAARTRPDVRARRGRLPALLGRADWRPRRRRPGRGAGTTTSAGFATLLEESIRLRLMSDVPLGRLPVRRHRQQRDRGADGPDDRPAAADVLGRLQGARVQRAATTRGRCRRRSAPNAHEIVIDDRDFFGALPRLIWHEDEPIAHPSSVPLYFVSKLAREKRDGRAHRRGQRRAARRLWEIPAVAAQLARRIDLREDRAPRGPAPAGGVGRARAGASRALRAPVLRRRRARSRPHVLRHLRRRRSGPAAAPVVAPRRAARRPGAGLRLVDGVLQRPGRRDRACSIACSTRT